MYDDERSGWRYPSRAQRARQARRDAKKKRGDRYYATHKDEIKFQKELKMKRRSATRQPSKGESFCTGWWTEPRSHPQPHTSNPHEVIVIDDNVEDEDDMEVVFVGIGRAAVVDDSRVVSFLPD